MKRRLKHTKMNRSNHGSFVHIIGQYYKLMERFAHRYMDNKQMAYVAVKECFESLYDEGKLVPGPGIRNLLKTTVIKCGQEIDASLARAEAALANRFLLDDIEALKKEK